MLDQQPLKRANHSILHQRQISIRSAVSVLFSGINWAFVCSRWNQSRNGGQATATANKMQWSCARPLVWTLRKAGALLQLLNSSDLYLDELIKLYKSVVETNANANAALSRANKEVNDGLSQLQSNFALAMQIFQDQVTHEIQISSTKMQSFFEKLVIGMDAAVQSMLSKIGSTLNAMESDAANLSKVSRFGRSTYPPKRLYVWLTCVRTSAKPISIPRAWKRILEKSFSRSSRAVQS